MPAAPPTWLPPPLLRLPALGPGAVEAVRMAVGHGERMIVEARFALGFALQYMDRFDDAIRELRQVTRETDSVVAARAQYHIGECFTDQGKHAEAAREYLTVVANFDFDGGYRDWYRRALLAGGLAYQATGNGDAAAAQWKELIERFPDSPEAKAAQKRLTTAR